MKHNEKLDKLLDDINEILLEDSEMETKLALAQEESLTLKEENEKLLERIEDLKKDLEEPKANNKELANKINELMRENAALRAEIIEYKKMLEKRDKKQSERNYTERREKPYISPKSRFRIGEK